MSNIWGQISKIWGQISNIWGQISNIGVKCQTFGVKFQTCRTNLVPIPDLRFKPTKDTKSTDKPRKKRFRDFDDIIDETPVKQHAPENDDIIVNLKSGVNPAANTVMEEAKKQIENRKKFLKNLTAREISKVAEIQTLSREGMDRARRAAELQARIQNAMQRNNPTMPFRQNGPTPLLLNDSGTRVDAVTGDVKMFQKAVPSLLANQNVMQREEIKKQNFVVLKAKVHTIYI